MEDEASQNSYRSNSPNSIEYEEETSINEVESKRSSRSDSENSFDDPPLKRMKPIKEDRLSELPDSMMTHVLSFLPVIDAVKTQLLSKRFRHIWASITSLLFPRIEVSDEFYAQFIINALMIHRGPLIKKLYLSRIGPSHDDVDPPINLWLQAVVIKRVEELVLEIDNSLLSFRFPNSLLSCDTLREFSLTAPEIELGSSVSWKSLKKLTLKSINNLDDDMIHKIVVGSPALECLNLIECRGFSRIIIDSSNSNLRNLVIKCDYISYGSVDDYLEILAPKITSLEISGYMGDKHCRLKEVSSLVRVALRFSMLTECEHYWDEDDNIVGEMSRAKLEKCEWTLLDLLRKTSHVEILSMGTWCTQVLAICELKRKPGILLKCKSLELNTYLVKSLPGIARLMQKSPYLETLLVDMNYGHFHQVESFDKSLDFSCENYWESKEKSLQNALQRLKVVELKGLDTSMNLMMELAEFLLQNAKCLEKLVYKPGAYAYKEYYRDDLRRLPVFNVINKLLSYPRSSPHARVLLL
ncbi:hypothetical protein RND81_06G117900 [Saponaria officinalis]|uniref:F-box domain-containing protein n=1 Tax=Saponaria officinalis TaxID=3572 RepID=A0AAW1K5J7_SAPOF